ncbi:hypothetical protein D5687_05405 [Guyparkeria sp. SCN-R1]|uniref:REP-associated tyrosine transposase n=1 Tax=Guyparkeria sp. SCN-R1 TaxID=2341113 RepID=UPI000F64ECBF|nr:transposase [Guyparkeria sp. SCN-R1]RRQ23927.1 hypothetical protein D5687_05405 [Guyparkeria sp. SCN-R1]
MPYNDLLRGRYSEPGQEYLVTAVTDKRKPYFESFDVARLLTHAFRQSHESAQAEWLAFVVMPDHFHALVRLRQEPLATVMRAVRGSSARRINRSLGLSGRVWQPGSVPGSGVNLAG